MAKKSWEITLDGKRHRVQLEHGFWSGKRIIYVDDQKVLKGKKMLDDGDNYIIHIGSHICIVSIKVIVAWFKYDLIVNDVSLEKEKKIKLYDEIQEEKAEWHEARQKGKLHFYLRRGVMPTLAIGGIFTLIDLVLGRKEIVHYYETLILAIIGLFFFGLIGWGQGAWKWRQGEKKFINNENTIYLHEKP